jgi:hypothetical protein
MQNKTEQLKQLFDDWEQAIPEYKDKFVRDRIINEKIYQTASSRTAPAALYSFLQNIVSSDKFKSI